MSETSTRSKKRARKLFEDFLVLLLAIRETVLVPALAAFLVIVLLSALGVTARMTPAAWFVAAPALYFLWVITYLALCAIHIQILFFRYSKPRHTVLRQGNRAASGHLRLAIAYGRSYLLKSLPIIQILAGVPWLRSLFLLAYAPRNKIGDNFFLAGFLYDPDLTEIGDNVVMGGGSILCAHALTIIDDEARIYASAPIRIGNRATIGGESRVAMGVTIGEDAVVEAFSNVVPLTTVGPGEVWGGNPAVFLRHRSDLSHRRPAAAAPAKSNGSLPTPFTAANGLAANKNLSSDAALAAALRVVAQAINLPHHAASEEKFGDQPGHWDSLQQVAIALTLEELHGCRLSGSQVFELCRLADVARTIENAGSPRQLAPESALPELPADPEWLPLFPSAVATGALALADPPPAVGEPISIVVAASFTAEPLTAALERWSGAFAIDARVEFCPFNQVAQALLDPASPFRRNAGGLNVVLVRLEDLGDSPSAAREAAGELLSAIGRFVRQSNGSASLIVGSLPPPLSAVSGAERRQLDGLRVEWTEQLGEIEGVEIVDFSGVVERIGLAAAGDAALEAAARAPFSAAVYRELGIELARLVRRRRRAPAKVLALDCDGVLWGGVLGEDGFDGIQIGPDGPGRTFQLFQRALLKLKERGVLLALVSRNDESDVLDVLDRHPGMLLRRGDVAAWRINWNQKSQNLRELAEELNLGLDSFVFVDDDPAQRLQIASHLPQVHVFPTPADPADYAAALNKLWIFDAAGVTAEDLARTHMMADQRQREVERGSAENLQSYLAALELRVTMRPAEPQDLSRVAQLIGKTNQFNLSLRRRSLEAVKALDDSHSIYVLSAVDRWGDYGQIGVAILRVAGPAGAVEIDTFLVSCRALGRGIEQAFLHGIAEIARAQGAGVLLGPFVAGPRNDPARDFFLQSGFRDPTAGVFQADLAQPFALPGHIAFQLEARDHLAAVNGRKG